MGLLKPLKCLRWPQILGQKEKLKDTAAQQFIRSYRANADNQTHQPLWGDELEFMIVGKAGGSHRLLLLAQQVQSLYKGSEMGLNPEFAAYMLETTPSSPYSGDIGSLGQVEQNMMQRILLIDRYIEQVAAKLGIEGYSLLCTIYPHLGVKLNHENLNDGENLNNTNLRNRDFRNTEVTKENSNVIDTNDAKNPRNKNIFMDSQGVPKLTYTLTKSQFFPDNAIAEHPRYKSFHQNIINRRGRPPEGYIPVMPDRHVPPGTSILIDSFGLGMGCCCLHTTFQAESLAQATYLFDQLAAVAPLLLRISRASPVAQGWLLATETRWDLLAFGADCRTDEERGAACSQPGEVHQGSAVPRSRFSSVDGFISGDRRNLGCYNDVRVVMHMPTRSKLIDGGVPVNIAEHVASLFFRDPLLIYDEVNSNQQVKGDSNHELLGSDPVGGDRVGGDPVGGDPVGGDSPRDPEVNSTENSIDEFLNLQTSNWKSVRLKLPNGEGDGWKVEFRVMEIQPTAFENAAYCVFVYLLTRIINRYHLNFYIPISLVDENFRRANLLVREAAEYRHPLGADTLRLFYRTNIFDDGPPIVAEGTVDEIFNGAGSYRGIVPLIRDYLLEVGGDSGVCRYVDFIAKRCAGEYLTVADWVRKLVISHEDYRNDSWVGESIERFVLDEYRRVKDANNPEYLRNR